MRPLRILNVAEKNDAAKELSRIMSRGQCLRVGPGKKLIILYTCILCKTIEDVKMVCFRFMWLEYFVLGGNNCIRLWLKKAKFSSMNLLNAHDVKRIKICSIVPAYLNSV